MWNLLHTNSWQVTYNKCSIRMIAIHETTSIVEEISFVNVHNGTPLLVIHKVTKLPYIITLSTVLIHSAP